MKKYIFVIAALLFLSINIYAQETNVSIESIQNDVNTNFIQIPRVDVEFLDAEKLFFEKKYYVAKQAFLQYLKKNPLSKNDMLYFYLGTAYFIDKDYKEAVKYYKLALDIKDIPSYYNNVGNAYYQMRDYKEAVLWYSKASSKLYSPYTVSTNISTLYKTDISTNITRNSILQNTDAFLQLENKISEIISNIGSTYIATNAYSAGDETFQSITGFIDPSIFILQMNMFTNIVSTNIVTNTSQYTNITLSFSPNINASVSNIPNFNIDTNITKSIYYSPYLHLGHTYLELYEFANAALSYEIFLTNVGREYYQFNEIDKVISFINSGKMISLNTNENLNEKVITNADNSITTEKYLAGMLTERYTLKPDKSLSSEVYYNDRSSAQKEEFPDGTIITETVSLYGGKEVEKKNPDGSFIRTLIGRDGSKYIYSINSLGIEYNYSSYPDGSIVTKIKDTNGENIIIERTDGSISRRTLTKDKTLRISTVNTDGSEIERTEYPKDKIITITKYSDGTAVNRIENIDKSVLSISKRPDGTTTTITIDTNKVATTKTVYQDGSIVTRIVDEKDLNASAILISETIGLDGSRISRTVDENGNTKTTTRKPDSTIVTETSYKDGTLEIITEKPDGSSINIKTYPGGMMETLTVHTDGSRVTETINTDGSSNTMLFATNGDMTTTTREKDGLVKIETITLKYSSVVVTKPNGESETVITKKDGTVINIKHFDKKNITTVNTNGNTLILTEENGESNLKATDSLGIDIEINTAVEMLKNALDKEYIANIQTTTDNSVKTE